MFIYVECLHIYLYVDVFFYIYIYGYIVIHIYILIRYTVFKSARQSAPFFLHVELSFHNAVLPTQLSVNFIIRGL